MAELSAFAAIRYDFDALGGDVSKHIAPPYDVLDQPGKDALLASSPHNIVAIDLPHVPPKSLGPPEAYAASGVTLDAWLDAGTLMRETAPAIYAYDQVFDFGGERYTRRMFIARLKAEPFENGTVLAHEETFGGPKEDRLALMKTTFANLSPVFGLFRDPEEKVMSALASRTSGPPDATGTMNGVENRLWVVTDPTVIDRVTGAFADKCVYIADGHHRYTTSLNFRDWVAGERGGALAADDPAGYVMVVFASMDDPGSLILPTHRVLAEIDDMPLERLMGIWSDGCSEAPASEADMTLYHGASGASCDVRFTNRAVLASLEPDKSAAWCGLDVAYLHRYLIDALYTPSVGGGRAPKIRYLKSEEGARDTAKNEHGIALMCKPATMDQLSAVSEAGDRMPQKSTYFYPKVATGLTMNPLR